MSGERVARAPSPAMRSSRIELCGRLTFHVRGRILSALLFRVALIVWYPVAAVSRAAAKPNIVLITLDSTRADRMGFLGAKTKLTPNLDSLARQSMIFEQAYSQAPLTVVSHATLLTGTYPQTHRVSEFGARPGADSSIFPDLLRKRGYRTAAFVGSIALDPRNGLAPGFDRGFSVYDAGFHPPEPGPGPKRFGESAGGSRLSLAPRAWLARNSKGPFFLWVHLNRSPGRVRRLLQRVCGSRGRGRRKA